MSHDCTFCSKVLKVSKACKQCDMVFGRPAYLKVHNRIHNNEKPYPCATCEKAFRTASQLNIHQRIHTGIKPYSCKSCGKSFRTSGCLNRHNRIHTGELPYSCRACGKRCRSQGNMIAHTRFHKDEEFFAKIANLNGDSNNVNFRYEYKPKGSENFVKARQLIRNEPEQKINSSSSISGTRFKQSRVPKNREKILFPHDHLFHKPAAECQNNAPEKLNILCPEDHLQKPTLPQTNLGTESGEPTLQKEVQIRFVFKCVFCSLILPTIESFMKHSQEKHSVTYWD